MPDASVSTENRLVIHRASPFNVQIENRGQSGFIYEIASLQFGTRILQFVMYLQKSDFTACPFRRNYSMPLMVNFAYKSS